MGPVLRAGESQELHEDLFALWPLLPCFPCTVGFTVLDWTVRQVSLAFSFQLDCGSAAGGRVQRLLHILEMRPGPSFPCL